MRFVQKASAALCVLVISVTSVLAQSNRGSIAGLVTDPSGAAIPGAAIAVRNQQTGIQANTVSTSSGDYRLPELPLGTYSVTATESGFQKAVQAGVLVQINTTSTVNLHLQPGAVSQTVTVEGNVPAVETQTSEIGTTVTPREVESLPLSLGGVGAFRSPEAFVFLTPGATGPGSGGSSNGIYLQKISGSENFGNEDLLDGISAVRPDNGSTFDETAPSVEAIQEFRVITSTPPAPFGRTTGGLISFGTKSGANQFHGAVFDIFRNTVMDANTWFNNGNLARCAPGDTACLSTNARPKDIKNDYGVAFNGPVWIPHLYSGRDKTFFFFAFEQLRWPRSSVTNSLIPTLAERGGDFTDRLTTTQIGTACGAPVYAGEIFDPTTTNAAGCRTQFMGNRILGTRISPVATKVLSYLPQPNVTGAANYNYSQRSPTPTTNSTYTIRIDHAIGTRDRLFASYSSRENTLVAGGAPTLPAPLDNSSWIQDFTTHFGRVGWDHTFSPSILNHLAAGYNRFNSQNNAAAVNFGQDWGTTLGIPGVSGSVFPQFNVGESYVNIGQQRGDDDIGNVGIVSDTVTISKGRHTLSAGFDSRFYQYNNLAYDNTTGNYNFSRGETAAANDPILRSQGGNSFAAFLLGATDSANLLIYPHYPRFTSWYNAVFLQDDVRASNKLTLNLGLRWSVDTPRSEAKNYTSNFDPTLANPGAGGLPGALQFGTNCGNCNPKWANTYWKDFAPRVGFAFTPNANGLTVFRAGYGIIYGPELYSDFGNSLNAGYAANVNPVSPDSSFTPAFFYQNGFPSYGPLPNLDPSLRNGSTVDYVKPQYGSPSMLQIWSFQVQQQLANDLIFAIGYVGNHATRERTAAGFGNVNDLRLSSFGLGSILNQDINSAAAVTAGYKPPYVGFSGTVGDSLRPFPQYRRINADCCLENDGQSTFHALEASLQRNLRNGLTLLISYTWSKTLTDSDSMLPGQNGGGGLYQNPFNLKEEKALSSQDIPHTFVASYVYDLPFGRGKRFLSGSTLANEVVGGWQVSGIQRYQSGQPLPFYCAGGIPGFDNCVRFNAVPGQSAYGASVLNGTFNAYTDRYINPAFFVDPNLNRGNGAYQLGSLPRVTAFRMQHFEDESFGLTKRFDLTEKARFTLRGEVFNAFNRHIFSEPYDLGPNDPNFGYINSTINSPRQIQVTGRVEF